MDPNVSRQTALFSYIASRMRDALTNIHIAGARFAPNAEREKDAALDAEAAFFDQNFYRLLRLVNEFSAECLNTEGPFPLQAYDVVKIVTAVCEQCVDLAALKGLDIRWSCPVSDHICLIDKSTLEELLYQMLSNSFQYTKAGGRIRVELKFKSNRVLLSVADTGRGLAPEQVTLLNRYLSGPPIFPLPQGVGLGLMLCRRIAEGHEGTIEVTSMPNQETRFTFSFPDQQTSAKAMVFDRPFDYTGGFHPVLLALADALPSKAFMKQMYRKREK